MDKTYYDPASPGSYGGIQRLHRSSKQPISKVKDFLQSQRTYQLHKQRRIRFKRRKYIVSEIDDLWQADLADMQKLKDQNDGFAYLLVVIDVFSKFLFVRPIRQKLGAQTRDAMQDIISDSGRKPKNLMTDKGTEFVNEEARHYYTDMGINFYTANNAETKAAVAERVIRTIKSRIYRYMTKNNTKRYIDVLQAIVNSYNNSKHRTIGMCPADVNAKTESFVRQKMMPLQLNDPKFKYKTHDDVRIAIYPSRFAKGYTPQWTDEIFQILKRRRQFRPRTNSRTRTGRVLLAHSTNLNYS